MEIIYAIPGLGTTKELYQNIFIPNYEIKVLDWPAPEPYFTLRDYSKQFLKQIDASKPVNLMGVSFGGMLCSELTDQLATKKVILISSCKNRKEFPLLLKTLKYIPLHKLLPDRFIKFISKIKMSSASPNAVLFRMMYAMSDNHFSRCINYIINWNKTESNPKLISIHGTADRLLVYKYIQNCRYTIKGGSHAMVLWRAEEINKILNKEFNGL